jgi:uncharacterized protein
VAFRDLQGRLAATGYVAGDQLAMALHLSLHLSLRLGRPLLLDVSGSMSLYARLFLAFLKGLVGSATRADAYLFHTRLIRVTEALTERDPLEAATRLSLMAEGFGGGTRIGHALRTFNDGHARRAIDRRTAVIILSDGYDTDPPERLAAELARLRRRARRTV